MTFLDPVLNPVLEPLLNINPFLGILVISLVISVIVTVAYKYLTNQTEMKRLKEEQKNYQKRMKELKEHPEEMVKIQKEAMKKNMEYMKHSFKPTLFTMLPLLLIFSWMTGHLMFEPIYPGETYSITATFQEGIIGTAELLVDAETEIINENIQEINEAVGTVTWNLKSLAGEHLLTVKKGQTEQTKKVLITTELKYEPQVSAFQHSDLQEIRINYNKLKPMGEFSLFGWQPGWLGLYIIFSIIFSMGLRKIMQLH